MKKTHKGSCHCGSVRFEADLDLTAGTFKCNCPMCIKTRMWGAFVKPSEFRLLAGEADLTDYQPAGAHHLFCRRCGVRPFAWGDSPSLGGKYYVVRVYCLDGVDINELMNAPIAYLDGAHDNYSSAPADTRHL